MCKLMKSIQTTCNCVQLEPSPYVPPATVRVGIIFTVCVTIGRVITCQQYTLLPMPCEVIDCIHHKAWQENTSTGLSIINH